MNGVGMADLAGKISSLSMNYWMIHVTVNDDDGYDDNSCADNHIDCDEL